MKGQKNAQDPIYGNRHSRPPSLQAISKKVRGKEHNNESLEIR
jgi:hypothetical protein